MQIVLTEAASLLCSHCIVLRLRACGDNCYARVGGGSCGGEGSVAITPKHVAKLQLHRSAIK